MLLNSLRALRHMLIAPLDVQLFRLGMLLVFIVLVTAYSALLLLFRVILNRVIGPQLYPYADLIEWVELILAIFLSAWAVYSLWRSR